MPGAGARLFAGRTQEGKLSQPDSMAGVPPVAGVGAMMIQSQGLLAKAVCARGPRLGRRADSQGRLPPPESPTLAGEKRFGSQGGALGWDHVIQPVNQ